MLGARPRQLAAGLQRFLGLFGLCTGKHMQPSSNLYRQALKIHDLVHYLAKQSYLDLFSVSLLSTLVTSLLASLGVRRKLQTSILWLAALCLVVVIRSKQIKIKI